MINNINNKMKIFGNDGFRSRFGEKYMTCEFLLAFANAVSDHYIEKKYNVPILIGRDTRESGKLVESILVSALNYRGINVDIAGVIPTPGLSSILSNRRYAMGIMITASHNPSTDNGIKLFAGTGFKLDALSEKNIEKYIIAYLEIKKSKNEKPLGKSVYDDHLVDAYLNNLMEYFCPKLVKERILVDCSNGAFSYIANRALSGYSHTDFINCLPNGNNINLNCGAVDLDDLLRHMQKESYDYGVAFDGDGDRAVFVSRDYGIIETEKLIVMFAKLLEKEAKNKLIVSTEICNKGMEKNCEEFGFSLLQTEVGDRPVVESTLKNNAIIGAEPSGHYIFPKCSKTMDGLVALFYFIELLYQYKGGLCNILRELKHFHRIKKNIPVEDGAIFNVDNLYQKVRSIIDNNSEKVVIRRSMWDPVIRIYYDYEEKNNFEAVEFIINDYLSKIL